jgi:hypothetical protein
MELKRVPGPHIENHCTRKTKIVSSLISTVHTGVRRSMSLYGTAVFYLSNEAPGLGNNPIYI